MTTDEFSINQRQVAYLLDVDARTIRAWQDAADDPLPCTRGKRGTANTYDPRLVVRWYINRRFGDLTNSESAGDPQQMRARLDKLRGDQVEHDLAIKRGEYAPIQALQFAVGDMAGQIKSIFEGLPKRIKNSMPSLRAREMKILERELVKAGNAIAEIEVRFDIEDEEAGSDA